MAVVAYTSYNENIACQRTNDYLTNGHGTDAAARSNRYVSDGHGQTTLCVGHNCPSDPALATEYMGLLRSNYERQHPPSKGRQKGSVTHVQFYVSPTEEDNVPAQERIDMTLELIQRTPLRDFSSILVPHDNTPDKHCHISLCPYSVDGTRKLCLNNSLLNTLRREMDRICVEHGYSIVENPELWADCEYREWFFQIKEQGIIKIHPPKDQDMSSFKKDRNRARGYAISKASQKKKQDDLESVCKYLSKKRLPGMEFFFYKSPYLYDPKGRDRHLHIRRTDIDGHKMGDLELQASSLMVWGSVSSQTLAQRNIPGSKDLQRRLDSIAKKAYAAKCLLRDLDIQTQAEFAVHKKECGQDLCELAKNIRYQEATITDTTALMNAIECWEKDHDQNAYTFLVEHQCEDDRSIAAAKTRYERAIARKVACEELLLKRKAEYRHLKEAEATLRPASSRTEWMEYLQLAFNKSAARDIGFCNREDLTENLYRLAEGIGLSLGDADTLINTALDTAMQGNQIDFRDLLRLTYISVKSNPSITSLYDEMRKKREQIHLLQELRNIDPVGPVTFLFSLFLSLLSSLLEGFLEIDIEDLRFEAETMRAYLHDEGLSVVRGLQDAKDRYDKEVIDATAAEISTAVQRFYQRASSLLRKFGIEVEPAELMNSTTLDQRIAEINSRKYSPSPYAVRSFAEQALQTL